MTTKELFSKIEQIKRDNPDLDIDSMEIGPEFNDGVIMMAADIRLLEGGAWEKNDVNGDKSIGIIWHC